MKLFVSALEYSANVHLKYLLRELALRENIELCGIFDESILDSAESQNLIKNNLARSANLESRPLRGAKNRNQASSSASADFLLEAEKRGSPPKSEKAAAFWRVGGAGRGVQPFCEKESSEISDKRDAKSIRDLQGGLLRSHLLARNDEILDSSLRKCSAQNDKNKDFAESSADSISGKSLCDTNSLAVMGFIDVLKKAKFFLDLRQKCLNLALSSDKILLMDSSSFNIPLAKRIKKSDKNKQIIYYILPQVWAWKPWRAKAIEANCDKLAAILPFEVERYKEKAKFVGHPLLDEIKYFRGGNSVLGMQFRTCEKFWESTDSGLVLSQNFSQIQKPHRNHFDCDSRCESTTKQTQNAESRADSAESQNLVKNNLARSAKPPKSFCYFWLLPKVETPLPLNPNLPNSVDSANSQNLKGGLPREQSSLAMTKNKESAESSNIFSFMPGSRFGEIKRIFPIFLQVKDVLKARDKDAKFHLIIPQKFASQNLAQIYGDVSDFHISFDAHLSLFQSRFAFICSGTATLECALIGTPFVLGYKCRALEAFIARCFLKIKFIGLANILYEKISPNEMFHTELIQGDLSARNLLNALDSADKSEFLRKSLALRKYLKNGASKAVAKMLYDL